MFRRITEHIYIYDAEAYTDRPNIGLICGSDSTLLFDAGNSKSHAEKLKSALRDAALPYPDFVALSHWHWDHSFALHAWNAVSFASKETNAELNKQSAYEWSSDALERRVSSNDEIRFCADMIMREYPDLSDIVIKSADYDFDSEHFIDLGGVTCLLKKIINPHSSDSVVCFVPEDRFLFLGDSNCKDLYGLPWHFDLQHEDLFEKEVSALPYDPVKLNGFRHALNSLDFDLCISGHAPIMSRNELFDSLN